jgi:hypothetical protein
MSATPDNGDWGDEQNHQKLDLFLKPAQTVSIYTAMSVPAKGKVVKLMVRPRNEEGARVLRYGLTDKVTPLQPPFADPAHPSGATALQTIPAQAGISYPMANLCVSVEKLETTAAALQDDAPPEGGFFLVTTLVIRNATATDQHVLADTIQPVLTSTDGAELKYQDMLTAGGKDRFIQFLRPFAEARMRIYFAVPQGATPRSLTIKEGDSRTYQWDAK